MGRAGEHRRNGKKSDRIVRPPKYKKTRTSTTPTRRPKARPTPKSQTHRPEPRPTPKRLAPSPKAGATERNRTDSKHEKGKSRQAGKAPARLDDGLTYHPACLLFPMMDENKVQELAEDIKESGQNQPVVLLGNVVLDGKNILAACKLAGVKPRFVQWEGTGSPTAWIASRNLFRRHLTSSQRAVIALKLLPILKSEARDRQHHLAKSFAEPTAKGKASENAAELVKSNSRYIEAAKAIERDAPELLETIRNGTLNIPDATALAKLPVAGRRAVVRKLSTGQPKKLSGLYGRQSLMPSRNRPSIASLVRSRAASS